MVPCTVSKMPLRACPSVFKSVNIRVNSFLFYPCVIIGGVCSNVQISLANAASSSSSLENKMQIYFYLASTFFAEKPSMMHQIEFWKCRQQNHAKCPANLLPVTHCQVYCHGHRKKSFPPFFRIGFDSGCVSICRMILRPVNCVNLCDNLL